MEYSNSQPPEGINASLEHPLKEFIWLSASVMAAFFALIVLAITLADFFSAYIPFEVEKRFTSQHLSEEGKPQALHDYLNGLAARLSAEMELPEGITITVHYLDEATVNAFATLGGNVYIFRGLLDKMPNENALAMVMAHEIAHIKHRDPIRGAGRMVVLGLAMSMLSSHMGNALLEQTLSQEATLTILKYSRDQESSADEEAIAALKRLYGHVDGAAALFEILQKEGGDEPMLEFFSTHPFSSKRIARVYEAGSQDMPDSRLTPLPENFASWLSESTEPQCETATDAGSK